MTPVSVILLLCIIGTILVMVTPLNEEEGDGNCLQFGGRVEVVTNNNCTIYKCILKDGSEFNTSECEPIVLRLHP